jgi:hypothetical protein
MELPLFTLDGGLANSLPFLFRLCWVMPVVGTVLLVRGEAAVVSLMRDQASKMAMVIALAVTVNIGFVRSPVAARLPDVAVPHTILGAWLLAALWRGSAADRWPATWMRTTGGWRRLAPILMSSMCWLRRPGCPPPRRMGQPACRAFDSPIYLTTAESETRTRPGR